MENETLVRIIQEIDNSQKNDESIAELMKIAPTIENVGQMIGTVIERTAVNRVKILNLVAVHFCQHKLYDNIIPLLDKALKLDETNVNTLYNIGYVLNIFKEHELALNYLNSINNKDDEVNSLILEIQSKLILPMISICIPTYNRAGRLKKCLESIYSQIGNDNQFEIVVSDNASTDNTKEVVATFSQRYNNLRYYRNKENIGAEKNLTNAVRRSSGEYVFLHGDDDYFVSDSLYMLANEVRKNSNCGVVFIDVRDDSHTSRVLYGMEQFLLQTSIYSTFCSSIIIRRQELFSLQNLEEKYGSCLHHLHWIYAVLEKNPKSLIINANIYFQELDNAPDGYSYCFAEVMIQNYFNILKEFIGKGLNVQLIKHEKALLVNRSLWYLQFGLQRKELTFTKKFEEIFYKYYHEEEYFPEAWQEVLRIKAENPL